MKNLGLTCLVAISILTLVRCDCAGGDDVAPDDGGYQDSGAADGSSVDASIGFPILPTGPIDEGEVVDTLATVWCQYRTACDCLLDDTYGDCVERYRGTLQGYRDVAQREGLAYDPACVERILGRIGAQTSCGEDISQLVIEDLRCTCPIFHGALVAGARCSPLAPDGATTCGRGLQCYQASCQVDEDCGEGGQCVANLFVCEYPTCALLCDRGSGVGQPCDPQGERLCVTGTICADGQTCSALPGIGEACHPFGCWAEESYCDRDTGMCVEAKSRGDVCTESVECESLNCQDGTCVSSCVATPF